MNVRPLHDRIIVQRIEGEQKVGGIIVPIPPKKPQRGKSPPGASRRTMASVATSGRRPDPLRQVPGQEIKLDGDDTDHARDEVLGVIEGSDGKGADAKKKK
jgi:chaperonin GroES